MMPGVSHRNSSGMSNASHSCMKRAALSAPSLSIAPARCVGLFAITPIGRPSMRMNAVTMPSPNCAAQFEHRAGVGERLDHVADVVDAQPVLGDRASAAGADRRSVQSLQRRPGSTTGTSCATRDRFGFVLDRDVDHAVRHLHAHRPDFLGPEHAEAAAFDHRRTAHRRYWSPSVAITTSQHPSSAALPAKHRPELMPTSGTSPLKLRRNT